MHQANYSSKKVYIMTGVTNASEGRGKPKNLTKSEMDELIKKMNANPISFAQPKNTAEENFSSVLIISPNAGAKVKKQKQAHV